MVTKQRFIGPYVIKNVVQGHPDVGVAYQLVNQDSGKVVRNLVTNDRLKRYNVDRDSFNRRLPSLQQAPNTERLVDLPQDNKLISQCSTLVRTLL